jgi:hypothetical protein
MVVPAKIAESWNMSSQRRTFHCFVNLPYNYQLMCRPARLSRVAISLEAIGAGFVQMVHTVTSPPRPCCAVKVPVTCDMVDNQLCSLGKRELNVGVM